MPSCPYECALVCYGDSSTGKGTLSAGVAALLGGGLVTHFSLRQISDPKSKNLAELNDVAPNLCTELDAIEVGMKISSDWFAGKVSMLTANTWTRSHFKSVANFGLMRIICRGLNPAGRTAIFTPSGPNV